MTFQKRFIDAVDGRRLKLYVMNAKGEKKGVVHILHGMGEHAERYEEFATYLTENHYSVYAHDHRLHGGSLEEDEAVGIFRKDDTFDRVIEDVATVQAYISEKEGVKDIITLGHSMGSLILRRHLQKDCRFTNKAIVMGTPPVFSPLMVASSRATAFLSGIFLPARKRNRLMHALMKKNTAHRIKGRKRENDWLTHDDGIVKDYEEDPRCGYAYNTYFYREFFKLFTTVNRPAAIQRTPAIPMLFISGEMDPLSQKMRSVERLFALYEKHVEGFQGTIHAVPNARHEVLNEIDRSETFTRLLAWIKES